MMTITDGMSILILTISFFVTYRYKNIVNKYLRQTIAILNCIVTTTMAAYFSTASADENRLIIVIVISLLIVSNMIVLIRMVGMNLPYRRMNKKEFVISMIFIVAVLYPLRKTELSFFSYQWHVIVAKSFIYMIVAITEEVAFRACFIKLFIKSERLDRIISEGPNKNETLGLLAISVAFALLHFEFSWQALYSLTFFSIACFFILISTKRISVVIILHFISNILI